MRQLEGFSDEVFAYADRELKGFGDEVCPYFQVVWIENWKALVMRFLHIPIENWKGLLMRIFIAPKTGRCLDRELVGQSFSMMAVFWEACVDQRAPGISECSGWMVWNLIMWYWCTEKVSGGTSGSIKNATSHVDRSHSYQFTTCWVCSICDICVRLFCREQLLLARNLGSNFGKSCPKELENVSRENFHLLDRAHSLLRNLWFTYIEDTLYTSKTSKKLSSRSDILYTNLTYLYKKLFHFKNCQLHLQTTRISLHVRQIHPWGIYGLWRVFTCAFGGLNDGKLDGANIWDWRPHHFSGANWNFYALEGLKVNVLNFCPRTCVFFRWFFWIGISWDQTHHLSRHLG